jgi:hypothetical protein
LLPASNYGDIRLDHQNLGPFLTAWGLSLAVIVVGLAMGFVNAVIGWIPAWDGSSAVAVSLVSSAYIGVVYAHLFGQFGKASFGQSQLATTV